MGKSTSEGQHNKRGGEFDVVKWMQVVLHCEYIVDHWSLLQRSRGRFAFARTRRRRLHDVRPKQFRSRERLMRDVVFISTVPTMNLAIKTAEDWYARDERIEIWCCEISDLRNFCETKKSLWIAICGYTPSRFRPSVDCIRYT